MEVFLYITFNEKRVREGSLLNGFAWGNEAIPDIWRELYISLCIVYIKNHIVLDDAVISR